MKDFDRQLRSKLSIEERDDDREFDECCAGRDAVDGDMLTVLH